MAENDDGFGRTLNDVISGYQGMQQTLGSFAGGRMTPQGGTIQTPAGSAAIPSPPPPTPVFTPPPPPPPPPFIPSIAAPPDPSQQMAGQQSFVGGGGVASAPMGGGGGMAGMMQQGVQGMRQNNINPAYAAAMDPSMNYPSAGMMTNPNMGIFRSQQVTPPMAAAPYSVSGQAPPAPLFPVPGLLRTRPEVQFQRPYEAAMYMGSEQQRLMQQGMTGFAQGAGATFNTAFGATIGTAGGAAIGGAIGGVGGAELGATIGGVGGAFLGMIPGANRATAALMRPAIERRAEGIQAQAMSRQFVVGGQDLDISGRGLSTSASMQFGQMARGIAGESGGRFTQQDVLQMTQVAGEQGLMEAAQSPEQMGDAIKQMMSLVGTLAEVTGDPDFRRNIKRLGQLKQMGMELDQMDQAAQNLAEYARMAGTTVDQVMAQGGAQGAARYQQQGLLAAQGMTTGAMAMGQATGMEASGAMSATQVALAGGQQGMQQRITEMSGAFLSQMSPAMMGAFVKEGPGGELTLDRERVQAVRTGDLSFQEAIQQGGNLSSDQLGRMISQMPELKAELGNQLGDQGTQMAMLQQVRTLADQAFRGDMRQAGMAMFGEQGGMVVEAMTDPRYLRQQAQQHRVGMQNEMFERMQARDAAIENQMGIGSQMYRGIARGLGTTRGTLDALLSPIDTVTGGIQERGAQFLARHEELARRERAGLTTYERGEGIELGLSAEELAADIDTSLTAEGRAVQSRRARGLSGYMDEWDQTYGESERLRATREMMGRGGFLRRGRAALGAAGAMGISVARPLEERLAGIFATPGFDELADENIYSRGAESWSERQARQAREAQEQMTNFMGQSAASRMSQGEMTAGRESLVKKIGGYSELETAQSKLARTIKEKVGFGIGEEDMLTREELRSAIGAETFDQMSEQEIGALVRGAAQQAGPEGQEWLRETQKSTGRVFREAAGEGFAVDESNLQGALEGAGFGSVFSSVMGIDTGITAMDRLSEEEKEVLKLMDSPIAAELVIAAMEAGGGKNEAKKLVDALMKKAKKEGPEAEKAQFERLETARAKVRAMEENAPEQLDILISKAKDIGGQKMQEALEKDKAGKAVEELQASVENLSTQMRGAEQRRSAGDAVRMFREAGMTTVSGKNYEEVLRSAQAEGAGRLEEVFGEKGAETIMGLDAGSQEDRAKFVQMVQSAGGGGAGTEAVTSKGVSEGIGGGAAERNFKMTQEMMATFGRTMMQQNQIASKSEGHLKAIREAVTGEQVLDVMNQNQED